MTVRLRAHHLLCILTYVGKGYTPHFTENMTAVAKRLSDGEKIEIVDGPDDICAPLLDDHSAHCYEPSIQKRDTHAATDIERLLGIDVRAGSNLVVSSDTLQSLRSAFASNTIRNGCQFCSWRSLCDDIARGQFEHTLFRREAKA